MNFKNDLLSCTIIHAQHLFQPFMLVMYSIMVTGLVYDSCLFMHSKQIFQGFHLSVHICLRSATTNKTDGCCIFSGKGWCWAVFTAWNSFWKSMLLLQDLKQVQRCFSVRALHLTLVLLSSCPHLRFFPLGTPSFIKSPEDQTGISGGVASFVCQAVGEPKPRITWMKKGKKVSSQRFEVRRVSSLSEVFECATPPCLTPSLLITCLHLCDTEQQVTRCHFIEHMQHAAQEDVCAFSRRGQTADWWCIYSLLPCTKNQTQQLSPFSACLKTT